MNQRVATEPIVSTPRALMSLFLASFSALFTELLLIRWLASEIPVMGYFKNFPLITVFIGLGVGCMLTGYRRKFWVSSLWVLAALAFAVMFTETLGLDRLIFPESRIDVWDRTFDAENRNALMLSFQNLGNIFIILCACAWSFVGVGQAIGAWLKSAPPLVAYTTDILGSLTGVLIFSVLSWLQTPPSVWLIVSALLFFLVGRRWCGGRFTDILPIVALVAVAGLVYARTLSNPAWIWWSPYYRIEVQKVKSTLTGEVLHYRLNVNRDIHQVMVDLSDARTRTLVLGSQDRSNWMFWRLQYDFPYLFKATPASVLIGGAGAGNDAAAALRFRAGQITAVEIDEGILAIGKKMHPSHPYDSPNVRIVNMDIRSFQRWNREKFDLIEYGILDSHTALSSLSSLRLDNYVYTVEAIRDAVSHLKPDGIMCISFYESHRDWLGRRMFRVIEQGSGRPPVSTKFNQVVFFIFGPGVDPITIKKRLTELGLPILDEFYRSPYVKPSTDDWPYLYSNPKGQPWVYYVSLLFIVTVGSTFTYAGLRMAKVAGGIAPQMDWHMFFLGAGFLLIETKALAELSLLFGSTWVVNTFVFAGIFVMVLCANQAVAFGWGRFIQWIYVFLFAILLAWYFFPRATLNALPFVPRALIGTFLVVLPLFFAGIVFSTSFAGKSEANVAFGSNLIGAVVGGATEAASLAFGIRALTVLAMGFYGLSWLTLRKVKALTPAAYPL